MTSRELFKQYGCSERLFQKVFEPMLHVGLFAPAEQCSAAATLAMLYYYIFSHQVSCFYFSWFRVFCHALCMLSNYEQMFFFLSLCTYAVFVLGDFDTCCSVPLYRKISMQYGVVEPFKKRFSCHGSSP